MKQQGQDEDFHDSEIQEREAKRLAELVQNLPFWETVTEDNAHCLSQEQFKKWLTIHLLNSNQTERAPVLKAFLFVPQCSKVESLDGYHIDEENKIVHMQRSTLKLEGNWFAELSNEFVQSLGFGTASIDLVNSRELLGYDQYGKIQKGIIEIDKPSLQFTGWLDRSLVLQHLQFSKESFDSGTTIFEFSALMPILGYEVKPELMYGWAGSFGCRFVGMKSGKIEETLASGYSSFVLSIQKTGHQKMHIAKTISEITGNPISETFKALSNLENEGGWDFLITENLEKALQYQQTLNALGAVVHAIGLETM